jgi:hypothetical protein
MNYYKLLVAYQFTIIRMVPKLRKINHKKERRS